MRKELLGLLAFSCVGLEVVHGQGYQEPAPIQYPANYQARFPNFNLRLYPQPAPMQTQPQYYPSNNVPSGYRVPMSGAPNFRAYTDAYAQPKAPVMPAAIQEVPQRTQLLEA